MTSYAQQQPHLYQAPNGAHRDDSTALSVPITGKLVVDSYQNGNYPIESPRFPQPRPISTSFVDLKDPIQIHLLTETALADSRNFQIVSQDQVDVLKKQCQYISQRIEQTKANLALQTKYRDAAISMTKLYTPGPRRRSLTSNRSSLTSIAGAREAEAERETAEKRCEELAAELFQLEKRLVEPQRRLLEHTSAILQLTHRASHKKMMQQQLLNNPSGMHLFNGMPGSPESLYTYSTNRSSLASDDDIEFDTTKQFPRHHANGLEIPVKSPIREQTTRLREDVEQLKEDNARLVQENQLLKTSESKLDAINHAVRDLIIAFNPGENAEYPDQPRRSAPGQLFINTQLDYLEKGIQMARQEQEYSLSNNSSNGQRVDGDDHQSDNHTRLRSINGIVLAMLASAGADQPPSPGPTGNLLEDEISYLERAINVAEKELGPRGAVSISTTSGNVEGELKMIWDNMQSRAAFMKKDREDRKKQRAEKGLVDEDDEEAEDEDVNEPYSFVAFTSKVNFMATRVRRLAEEKVVLKRQIKQQRELNQKADAEEVLRLQGEVDNKQAEIIELRTQLAEVKDHLDSARAEISRNENLLQTALRDVEDLAQARSIGQEDNAKAASLQTELETTKTQLNGLQQRATDLETRAAAAEASRADAEVARQQTEARLTHSEATRKDLEVQVAGVDTKISELSAQLAEAVTARAAINEALEAKQKEVDMKTRQVQEKEDLLESMNLMLAELKTELTIAQAELDGAYGSRAERAKDIAAMKSTLEVQKMQTETDTLRKELATTVKQLQEITSVSIAAETEKAEIEARLDDAEQARGTLESELEEVRTRLDKEVLAGRERMAKLQESLDEEKLKGGAAAGLAKGASMLSEQFRLTMREERRKFQDDMREEQTRRRKVEEELRQLRRAAGMRSPMTPAPPTGAA
ncbi:ATPase involved in DNA repair [Ceratocystis platani]|uniref:ATPase involved in DNA repair n=1 Tax=Ceratocystis fimbriata f. sp. platani TaxID=88771 RepID=A0A0F8DFA6_CERFI|nr:ATPase involved in DNA repair [Ceratocystis platani]